MSVKLSDFLALGGGVKAIPANTFDPATMLDVTGFYSTILNQDSLFNDLAPKLINNESKNAVVVVGTELYSIGGFSSAGVLLNTLTKIDTILGTVTPLAPLPSPIMNAAAAAVGNIIYVYGGGDLANIPTNAFYSYDISTNVWTTLAAGPDTVYLHRMIAIGTNIYSFGGEGATLATSSKNVNIYNTITGTWSLGQPVPMTDTVNGIGIGRYSLEAIGDIIYLISGFEYKSTGSLTHTDRVISFNTITNVFDVSPLASIPTPTPGVNKGINEAMSAVIGGNIYIIRGLLASGTSNDIYMYNPLTNTWTSNPDRTDLLLGQYGGMNAAIALGGHLYRLTYQTGGFSHLEVYNPLQIPSTTQQKIIIDKG